MELIAIIPHKKRYRISSLSEAGLTITKIIAMQQPIIPDKIELKFQFLIVLPT